MPNNNLNPAPMREKTIDEKVNESYTRVGELVIKFAKIEEDAQALQKASIDVQNDLRASVDTLRNELKLREGTKLSASVA